MKDHKLLNRHEPVEKLLLKSRGKFNMGSTTASLTVNFKNIAGAAKFFFKKKEKR